jgi:hypothetical protein
MGVQQKIWARIYLWSCIVKSGTCSDTLRAGLHWNAEHLNEWNNLGIKTRIVSYANAQHFQGFYLPPRYPNTEHFNKTPKSIGMFLTLLANIPGFNLHWNNSVSMQERILALILFLISFKRWAFEWCQKEAMSVRCVGVIVYMIKLASKCERTTKHDTQTKCKRASTQTQTREGVNANTTNATSKQREKQIWQANNICQQMWVLPLKVFDGDFCFVHGWSCWRLRSYLVGVDFGFVRGNSCWQNSTQGG